MKKETCFACEFLTTDYKVVFGGEIWCNTCIAEVDEVYAAMEEDWTESDLENFYHQVNG